MLVLALDVDGVLLDPDRGDAGHWTVEMERSFEITRSQFRASFFMRSGCRVVLATNQEHRRAAFLRERLGALMPIDDVLYSADLGSQKHEAAFFERASERLGLGAGRRGDVVFVDDLEHNVDQARAAGWCAVHAPPGGPVATWVAEADRLLRH
jgi:FMN phosphatase YigB (HAD superfamily)